jgi:hypothetical protein
MTNKNDNTTNEELREALNMIWIKDHSNDLLVPMDEDTIDTLVAINVEFSNSQQVILLDSLLEKKINVNLQRKDGTVSLEAVPVFAILAARKELI